MAKDTPLIDPLITAANTAANLVKSTADATATSLNIQYIQRDITDIKLTLKSMVDSQEAKIEKLEDRINAIARVVYIGVGISIAFSVLVKLFVK